MKRFLFLATFLLSLVLSPTIEATISGMCGDNITWTLDDNNNLILVGTGDIYDYDKSLGESHPWDNTIKTVTMSGGITRIGNNAFSNCTFTRILIPNSVTSIGDYAFDN